MKIKRLQIVSLIIFLSIANISCDTNTPTNPRKKKEEASRQQAADVLKGFCDRVSKAQSFWVKISCTNEDKSTENQSPSTDGEYVFAIRRPNKAALFHMNGKIGFTLICDGFDLGFDNTISKRGGGLAAPKELAKIPNWVFEENSQYMAEFVVLTALFSPDPFERLKEIYKIGPYVGIEKIDDQPCHHFKMTNKEFDSECWITVADPPSLRRIVATRLVTTRYGSKNQAAAKVRVIRDFGTWNFDIDLPIEVFNVQFPKEAKKINLQSLGKITTTSKE